MPELNCRDDCPYCGAPPGRRDPTWDPNEDAYVPRGVCPQCGADLIPAQEVK